MPTTLQIEFSNPSGKKGTKNVPNINPDASDQDLNNFAKRLNGLTQNTWKGSLRVDKTDISVADEKTDITARANPTSIDLTTIDEENWHEAEILYRDADWTRFADIIKLEISLTTDVPCFDNIYLKFSRAKTGDTSEFVGCWNLLYKKPITRGGGDKATGFLTAVISGNDTYNGATVEIPVTYETENDPDPGPGPDGE